MSFFSILFVKGQITEVRHLKKYTQSEGLSSYNIRKITQDNKGFMWIATQDGLNRFDSKVFMQYNKNAVNDHKLSGADIKDIVEDSSRNVLWSLSSEAGLNAIDLITGKVIKTLQTEHKDPNAFNICMILNNNKLWIGSSTGLKVFDIVKDRFEHELPLPADNTDVKGNPEIDALVSDIYGNIWAGIKDYGIIILDGLHNRILKKIPAKSFLNNSEQPDTKINNFILSAQNEILFSTDKGLRGAVYNKQYNIIISRQPCKSLPLINNENIQFICKSNHHLIYAASRNSMYRFNEDMSAYKEIKEPDNPSEGIWVNTVKYLYTDNQDNLWLGCQQGLGFMSANVSPFSSYYYSKTNYSKLEHVRSVFPDSDRGILVGLRNGLAYIDNKKNDFTVQYPDHLFYHIFADWQNLIHVSRDDGMFIYKNGNLFPVNKFYPEFTKFSSCTINSHLTFGDSVMILGTENLNGILVWNFKTKSVWQINQNSKPLYLKSNIVNNIFKDNKENLFVLSDYNITVLSDKLKTIKNLIFTDTSSKEPLSLYFDMCEARGFYWITSYGNGLLQLDSTYTLKRAFNSKNGLCNDGVYQVYNIGDTGLLITTNNGLSHFNLRNFLFRNYFDADGLHSNSFEEVAGTRKDDLIYAGGVKGFTIINPKLFAINTVSPKLYISNLNIKTTGMVYDINNIDLKSITIPNTVLQTNIYFSALNYTNPARTLFSYRIKEIDNNWINLGNQNFVTLIGFSPGIYTIEVTASNEDGFWSKAVVLKLIFLPKWYQTWWFYLLIILSLASAGYALYMLRINELKREQIIRRKIAIDLHDDLGSTLNSVNVYANLAIMEKKDTHLLKIKESMHEAITSLRDIIWVMDDKKNSFEHLVSRISRFFAPLCEANSIRFEVNVNDEALYYKLNPEEKRNLYMIIKEALNNSIKYAEADAVNIDIILTKGKPTIIIKDDGKGFDVFNASAGNGLNNMRLRAGQMHYNIVIQSMPGTSIQLQKR